MALTITAAPSDELLSVEEAKRHLSLMSSDLDDEIASLIRVARDDAERDTQRTLRGTVTRLLTQSSWWCSSQVLSWPPLIAVSSVTYYDADNASQTLLSSNYHVELSTEGFGRIIWTSTATIPVVYDRPDAISITFTTGYATATAMPPTAMQGIKVRLTEFWNRESEGGIKAAVESSKRLLYKVDATGYA